MDNFLIDFGIVANKIFIIWPMVSNYMNGWELAYDSWMSALLCFFLEEFYSNEQSYECYLYNWYLF